MKKPINNIEVSGSNNIIIQDVDGSTIELNTANKAEIENFLKQHADQSEELIKLIAERQEGLLQELRKEIMSYLQNNPLYNNNYEKIHDAVLFLRILKTDEQFTAYMDLKAPAGLTQKLVEDLPYEFDNNLFERLIEYESVKKHAPGTRLLTKHMSPDEVFALENEIEIHIFENFITGEIKRQFQHYYSLLKRRKIEKLTLVISSNVAEINNIPFECMRNSIDGEAYALQNNAFSILHTCETEFSGFDTSATKPMAPPLKILYVASLPVDMDENARFLELEREQEKLIEATANLIAQKLLLVDFLDVADLQSIETALEKGGHHILHISGHGSHGNEGTLYLETEEGKTQKVTGGVLAQRIKKYHSLKLVVLSACETARAEDQGVAGAIMKEGIPAVLAMRYPVTDQAATLFTSCFYQNLCNSKSLREAVYNARNVVLKNDKQRRKQNQAYPMEWFTPFLYLNQNLDQLIDYSLPEDKSAYFTEKPINVYHVKQGEKLKKIGSGFIGRHKHIIKLNSWFNNGKKSICIHGLGGLGKTTLAIRFADNFKMAHHQVIQFESEITETQILKEILEKTPPNLRDKLAPILDSPKYNSEQKLQILFNNYLNTQKIIFLFDNFEDNQNLKKHHGKTTNPTGITSDALKTFLQYFIDNLPKTNYILFTTRYPINELQGTELLDIGEMNFPEAFRLMNQYEHLVTLTKEEKKLLHERLGGHPRAYTILDRLLKHQKISWQTILEQFTKLDKEANLDLMHHQLWDLLNKEEQEILRVASVFRLLSPVSYLEDFPELNIDSAKISKILGKLNDLSFIYLENNKFFVHRITANFVLDSYSITTFSQKKELHHAAGVYLCNMPEEKRFDYWKEHFEARWHFIMSNNYEKAVGVTFYFDIHFREQGFAHIILDMYFELINLKLSNKVRAAIYYQIGVNFEQMCEYDNALDYYNKSLDINKKNSNEIEIAHCYHQIGTINYFKGEDDFASDFYKKALGIYIKNKDNWGESQIYHLLGMILTQKREYDEALEITNKSLTIKQKIKDIRGTAQSYTQIGNIYTQKGEYDSAMDYHIKSKEIKEKMGDILGIAQSFHQIGNLHLSKNEYEDALEYYNKSLIISQNIKAIKGVSQSFYMIGQVHEKQNEFDSALIYYNKSLKIREKTEDLLGIGKLHNSIALIYKKKKNNILTLKYLRNALNIFNRIGTNPQKQIAQELFEELKQSMGEEAFEEALKEIKNESGE